MNKLEEIVYHALYNHPTLKLFVDDSAVSVPRVAV